MNMLRNETSLKDGIKSTGGTTKDHEGMGTDLDITDPATADNHQRMDTTDPATITGTTDPATITDHHQPTDTPDPAMEAWPTLLLWHHTRILWNQ